MISVFEPNLNISVPEYLLATWFTLPGLWFLLGELISSLVYSTMDKSLSYSKLLSGLDMKLDSGNLSYFRLPI